MLEKKIQLKAFSDVKEFVKAAEKCEYDVDVFYNRVVVDAKSIMGIFSLDLSKPIDLNIHAEGNADEVMEVLKPYLI